MRDQDNTFLHQAAEALINESQCTDIDPVINELLKRLSIFKSNQLNDLDLNDPSDMPRSSNEYLSNALGLLRKEQSHEPPSEVSDSKQRVITSEPNYSHTTEVNIKKIIQYSNTSISHERKNSLKVDSKVERTYKCSDCHLAFFRSSDLRRHEKIHLPVFPNVCAKCGKGFARKDALKRHYNTLTCRRNRNKLLNLEILDPKVTIPD